MEIKKRLYELRTAKGYSVAALAKKSGVAASHIQRIEGGESNPTVDRLERLCDGLGITIMDFFNEGNKTLAIDMIEFISKIEKLSAEQVRAFNTLLDTLGK